MDIEMTEAERRTIYANIDKRRIRELEARVKRLEEENKALSDRVQKMSEYQRKENKT